jgi:predicted transcriptional regulator
MFEISQLKHIRKQLNLTQNQFAKRAGVSQSLIAKIEANKIDPTFSKVKKIEGALNQINNEQEAKAKDIMVNKVISVPPSNKVPEIVRILHENAISQVLVISEKNVKGVIYESNLLEKSSENNFSSLQAEDVMIEAPPVVSEETNISVVSSLLKFYPLVLVSKEGSAVGVIAKSDLLKSLL